MWTCFACLNSLQFEAEDDFLAHTLQEHGETISKGQMQALAAACKTSITVEITSCPLCAWPTWEEGEVSQVAILDHIAEHVHAFSLRALPWAPDAVHETDAGIQKAATKVQPWLTKHNLTSEMLTVTESSITTLVPSSPAPHHFDTHDNFGEDSDNSSCSTVSDGTIERELREEPSPIFEDSDPEDDVPEEDGEDGGMSKENEDDFGSDIFVGSPEGLEIETSGYVSRLQLWYSQQDTRFKKGHSNYARGDSIGVGTNSKVRKSRYWKEKERFLVAIKRIMKNKVKNKVEEIYQEIELLQYVRHPNIVSLVHWWESKDEYSIVTDLADGGALFDYIVNQGRLIESKARRAVSDILAAVEYLHYHGIVHRHLAAHKFAHLTKDEGSRLILISLAHADWEKTEERSIISMSPPISASRDTHFGAFAPEIMLQERSGKPADMWSIGAIAYLMFVGCSPFKSENLEDLILECTQMSIAFNGRYWKDISGSAKDFIRRLLKPKPEDRLTIEAAKQHTWITGKEETTQMRGHLVRARWKCVILKIQLLLRMKQLASHLGSQGRNEDDTQDDSSEHHHKRKRSASQRILAMDPILLGLERHGDILNDYKDRCQKSFRTAVLARVAAENLERLMSDRAQARPSIKLPLIGV